MVQGGAAVYCEQLDVRKEEKRDEDKAPVGKLRFDFTQGLNPSLLGEAHVTHSSNSTLSLFCFSHHPLSIYYVFLSQYKSSKVQTK